MSLQQALLPKVFCDIDACAVTLHCHIQSLCFASAEMDYPTSSMSVSNPVDDGLHNNNNPHTKYSDFVQVAALSIGIPIIIFGVLGNLMTIIAVMTTKMLRTGENIFIISLSIFDLMHVIIVIPTILSVIWNNSWVFGNVYCHTYSLVLILILGGNMMSLSGTSFSRYLKIIHPTAFRLVFGSKLNFAIFMGSFLSVPVLIALPPVIGVWGKLGYNPKTIICTYTHDNSGGYTTFLMLFAIIVPIMIISYCYLRILHKVCSNRRKVQAGRPAGDQPVALREDLRYTRMMVSIFLVFLLSCTPFVTINLIDPHAAHMTARFFTMVCFWLSSCVNPFLYGLLNRNFRQAYLNIYKHLKAVITSTCRAE